jgi:hypothetical protein
MSIGKCGGCWGTLLIRTSIDLSRGYRKLLESAEVRLKKARGMLVAGDMDGFLFADDTWAELIEQDRAEKAAIKAAKEDAYAGRSADCSVNAQAQAESPDDEIEKAWNQDRKTKHAPEVCGTNDLDDILQSIKEEYWSEAQQPPTEELTPEAAVRRTAADRAVAKAVASSSGLTEECPLYVINRAVANCRVLTSTERCCIGLLNSLMQKHGYAYVGLQLRHPSLHFRHVTLMTNNGFEPLHSASFVPLSIVETTATFTLTMKTI